MAVPVLKGDRWTPERVLALRERLSLTQEALGREIGVSARQVSRWEQGQGHPHLSTAKRLDELEKGS